MWRDWPKLTQEANTATAPDESGEFDIVAPRRGTDADLEPPFLPAHVQMETCHSTADARDNLRHRQPGTL
jgi:hypothetical protein